MFPNGKMKALTISYDDGVEQDRKLVEILNRYHIKATFNLNSGIQSGANKWEREGCTICRMNIDGLPELYAGHEIAVHTLTHPRLETLDEATIINEIAEDKRNLERIFGKSVIGMAYPFGTFNNTVKRAVRNCGLRYARGVVSTHSFLLGGDLIEFQPTLHHNDTRLMELAEIFVKSKPDTPQLFYLWGHSYEFDINNNWNIIEDFCRLVSGRDDIFYGTNAEAFGITTIE
ncbi:polysaccharide deacetylase [Spirochaetia bacterium]|nr:polysaccharide deacetylase [Spirochaetia bacterium]GHU34912.1 polysaccharide deacetylase [Spirochaetia bacterium]